MSTVKENTLRRVEDFFVKEIALRGNTQIQVRLDDLKHETKLSLVTIYKALADLVEEGKLEIFAGVSKRSPKTYRYVPKFESHELNHVSSSDVGGLSKTLEDFVRQLHMKDQVINTLRDKLAELEEKERNVLYRLKLSDNTEIIVRKC